MTTFRPIYLFFTSLIAWGMLLSSASAQCVSYFDYSDYDGPLPQVGGLTFENLSTGAYTDFSWDFGDGLYDADSEGSVTHFYTTSGTYEVILTVWNNDPQNCFSQYSKTIEVFIAEDPCEQLDCVWPGDTNGDGKADLEDLINIGLGYGMVGPARDTTSVSWEAQPATDWESTNALGVNYKHFDCNGDGTISLEDVAGIQENYAILNNSNPNTNSGGIPVSLSFNVDTVVITDPDQYLEISAALKFGSSDIPMSDVFGVVLYLNYPKNYVVADNPVDFNYNENSFFGDYDETLPLSHNLQEHGQMDVVIARKDGVNTSGQGRVATISFIIDSDIIDGRVIDEGQDFPVEVNVVSAVDIDGNPLDIEVPSQPAGVFFQNGIITSTTNLLEDNQLKISPNPVEDLLQVEVGETTHPESIEIFDVLGKQVYFSDVDQRILNIDMSQFQKGMYIIRVHTEEGMGAKRIMKK